MIRYSIGVSSKPLIGIGKCYARTRVANLRKPFQIPYLMLHDRTKRRHFFGTNRSNYSIFRLLLNSITLGQIPSDWQPWLEGFFSFQLQYRSR